ncbi:MAG: amidohydrolase family protein [Phycisphaeraceae bacterium]|nr:amidohydrolase family protein [Phycisphaeraceae bacterium]
MNPPASREHAQPLIIIARAAADARGHWSHRTGPIALLLDQTRGRVLSITPASDLPPELCRSDIPTIERTDAVLLPGLVNAHTHLDLTDIGPRPHDPANGFMPWIDMVRRERPNDDAAIAAAVRRGISLSLAGGTAAVGDIAGAPRATPSTIPFQTLAESSIASVSYIEFFAIGNGLQRGMEAMTNTALPALGRSVAARYERGEAAVSARFGLQPHAPNTVALAGYQHALEMAGPPRNFPVCTHLAESPEEREFIARARGPQRDLLESLGLWNDAVAAEIGRGLSPSSISHRSWNPHAASGHLSPPSTATTSPMPTSTSSPAPGRALSTARGLLITSGLPPVSDLTAIATCSPAAFRSRSAQIPSSISRPTPRTPNPDRFPSSTRCATSTDATRPNPQHSSPWPLSTAHPPWTHLPPTSS